MKAEIELRGRNFTLAIPLGSEPPSVIGGGARFEELDGDELPGFEQPGWG